MDILFSHHDHSFYQVLICLIVKLKGLWVKDLKWLTWFIEDFVVTETISKMSVNYCVDAVRFLLLVIAYLTNSCTKKIFPFLSTSNLNVETQNLQTYAFWQQSFRMLHYYLVFLMNSEPLCILKKVLTKEMMHIFRGQPGDQFTYAGVSEIQLDLIKIRFFSVKSFHQITSKNIQDFDGPLLQC